MGRLPVLFIAGLLIFIKPFLLAQDESAVRALIREGDLKKLAKADDYKTQADQLTEDASRLNMEVFTVQSDQNLDQKAISKKVKQLETQAIQKQTEAAELYEKGNEIRFSVYKQYIDEFWKSHENQESDYLNAKLLEEQSSDNYFQAASYRIEARKMEDLAKMQKLTEATELENQAISKQLLALSQYHGLSSGPDTSTPAETPAENIAVNTLPSENMNDAVPSQPAQSFEPVAADTTNERIIEETFKQESAKISVQLPSDTSLPDGMVINQSMIDTYNRYISTGQFNDTSLATGKFSGVTSFDHDRLLQMWYEYIYGRGEIQDETAMKDTLANEPKVAVVDKTSQAAGEKEIGIVTDENIGKLVPADEEVVYRVQVAANRNELSQRALGRMYYGNKTVEMINENGWYKYSVGDFESYEEANKFRKSSGISNAFVVAYRKGTRFQSAASSDTSIPVQQNVSVINVPSGTGKLPLGLIFRIQVAASRVPLSISQLKAIYSGPYPVEMISEEGWYKYQFMGVRLYSDAIAIIRDVKSPGAFIVAYQDGIKTDLAAAVRSSRETEARVRTQGRKGIIQDVEYHLQIAASRMAFKKDEMTQLWPQADEVSVIYEDGWYKYHLKAGNSFETAQQLLQSCNIKGAFIVAYKKAAKVNYYQALHE